MSHTGDRLESAIDFARDAGAITLEAFYSRAFDHEHKADGSDVTTADRAAETRLRELITTHFPDDGILGEEHDDVQGTSGYRWILDPIDGTKSFVHGVPLYGTLVAIEKDGVPVAGVMRMPALDEVVYGGPGLGAWHQRGVADPVPARVTGTTALDRSMVCVTAWDYFVETGRAGCLEPIMASIGAMRGWSDCYAHVLLVTGRCDAVVEPILFPWDIAASIPIIEAAGGAWSDWEGARTPYPSPALLTNGSIHGDLLEIVRPFAQ